MLSHVAIPNPTSLLAHSTEPSSLLVSKEDSSALPPDFLLPHTPWGTAGPEGQAVLQIRAPLWLVWWL